MFIELVDMLRCPAPHEESWLVATAERIEERHIVTGTLGCPVCSREYLVRDGVVQLGTAVEHARHVDAEQGIPKADGEQAMRLAALLGLDDARGFVLLVGGWGCYAPVLSAMVDVPLILVNPPAGIRGSTGVSVIRSTAGIPLASGVARATAMNAGADEEIDAAAGATRAGGRFVLPASARLPRGVRELVRDDVLIVGEVEAQASPLVTLTLRRG